MPTLLHHYLNGYSKECVLHHDIAMVCNVTYAKQAPTACDIWQCKGALEELRHLSINGPSLLTLTPCNVSHSSLSYMFATTVWASPSPANMDSSCSTFPALGQGVCPTHSS